ncbi:hypothetical protein HK096_004271, partial [Nowakowskiella sp. JEL0078]
MKLQLFLASSLFLAHLSSAALLGDWAFCTSSSECSNKCCSKQYSGDGKLKCTPGGSPSQCLSTSTTTALKANWEFCTASSQCANKCCSTQYSGDGKLKCTPGGSPAQCVASASLTTTTPAAKSPSPVSSSKLSDWQLCTLSSQCTNGCCSKQYSGDGNLKCTPGGSASQCVTSSSTSSGSTGTASSGTCANPNVKTTEFTTVNVNANEDEVNLKPIAISGIPSGGSRVAFMGSDGLLHVVTLKSDDSINSSVPTVNIKVHDFADIYADNAGFVILGTRDATGGGTLNCGIPSNLCGTVPNPPVPCYDMYLIRYDYAKGAESWATKLTSSSGSLPPYSTSKTGPEVFFIWWYAHHGRIAFDGTNWAAYFGAAISVSEGGCINIHQGDRMKVVSPTGAILANHNSFDWGCSHSGYERLVYDSRASKFVMICKTDNNNRIAFAPAISTIYPVDLWYSNLGNVALDAGSGYWMTVSSARSGQPANSDGLADIHLVHFTGSGSDKDIVIASPSGSNARAPHLTSLGSKFLLAGWDTATAKGDFNSFTSGRKSFVQVRDSSTGAAVSGVIGVSTVGNRYQEFKSFADGSVAYASIGSAGNKVSILRIS